MHNSTRLYRPGAVIRVSLRNQARPFRVLDAEVEVDQAQPLDDAALRMLARFLFGELDKITQPAKAAIVVESIVDVRNGEGLAVGPDKCAPEPVNLIGNVVDEFAARDIKRRCGDGEALEVRSAAQLGIGRDDDLAARVVC